MKETEKDRTRPAGIVKAEWGDSSALAQLYVDELFVQGLQDHLYVVFGQLQMPQPSVMETASGTVSIQIQPVAKVVFTKATLLRMLDVLNRVAAQAVQEES